MKNNTEAKIIQTKLRNQMHVLRRDYHVKRLGVFGSVVRGEQEKGSDVDILVEFKETVGFFTFLHLEDFLSKTLHKKVDLVSKKAVKSAVKKQIFKEVQYV